MLQRDGIAPESIKGYEQCEYTHAAVAAFVASGMADAGYGVETPARQFKLEFIPNQMERYFLLCHERALDTPALLQVLNILCSDSFKAAVNQLPGYQAEQSGSVMKLDAAFVPLRAAAAGRSRT